MLTLLSSLLFCSLMMLSIFLIGGRRLRTASVTFTSDGEKHGSAKNQNGASLSFSLTASSDESESDDEGISFSHLFLFFGGGSAFTLAGLALGWRSAFSFSFSLSFSFSFSFSFRSTAFFSSLARPRSAAARFSTLSGGGCTRFSLSLSFSLSFSLSLSLSFSFSGSFSFALGRAAGTSFFSRCSFAAAVLLVFSRWTGGATRSSFSTLAGTWAAGGEAILERD
ncbi:hypothetical protein EYF80_035518 [Liparis tanakae]|uniref:Uncharacterized protein n=1 Tax=Liparis tanakae TaxID=230148 RepID=A0A4Z2GM38_9TELE|nr:hypothetical protein EYF80_035518 [Liparis tanakae]